ncbi:MAG TPA: glycoside hydrolase family 5 protein [Rhizomicrobium sp.]
MRPFSSASRIGAVVGVVLAAALAGCASISPEQPKEAVFPEQPYVPIDAFAQNTQMGRGVAVLSEDPGWNDPAKGRFTPRHFKLIRDAGFDTVRIVLTAFDHMDAAYTLDPRYLERLDLMVKAALAQDLNVVIDEHDYELCGKDVVVCKAKLNAFWSQVAPRYKDAPNKLVFEMLNEPHEALTPELWNEQLVETLAIIRATNPTRNVVIGPGFWNGLELLPKLELPADDQHIIATVHYYHPMEFTHQGAAWTPQYEQLGVTWGSDADFALLNKEFDIVKAWSEAHNRPIFLGEFGAYENGATADRVRWTSAVVRGAEARGFSWAYWQFDKDFIVYDIDKDQWVEPILHALIPPNDKVSDATH